MIGGIAEAGTEAPLRSAELWDPATRSFIPAASMAEARGGHSETLLPDGRVLVAGGNGDGEEPLAATEIWESASG